MRIERFIDYFILFIDYVNLFCLLWALSFSSYGQVSGARGVLSVNVSLLGESAEVTFDSEKISLV
jgi:hypothetical protein